MPVIVGFLSLGFLIGNLVGLTSSSVVAGLIPLLFVFGGGSAIAFLGKLDRQQRNLAGTSVAALSVACLVGVYTAILVTEYRLLSPGRGHVSTSVVAPKATGTASKRPSMSQSERSSLKEKYLNADVIPVNVWIDQQYNGKSMTLEEAYRHLQNSFAELLRLYQSTDGEAQGDHPR